MEMEFAITPAKQLQHDFIGNSAADIDFIALLRRILRFKRS